MLPKKLYDAEPYLFMAVGAMTTVLFDSPIKFMPAILFFAAGMLIFVWRHTPVHNRHHAYARQRRRS